MIRALRTLLPALLVVPCLAVSQPSRQQVRMLYGQALHDRMKTEELIARLNKPVKSPFEAGYLGAARMVAARYGLNPFKKFATFTSGRALLDEAIANDPHNAELRYLRYGIQTNAPRFLGYCHDIDTDRAILVQAILNRTLDDELIANIAPSLHSYLR